MSPNASKMLNKSIRSIDLRKFTILIFIFLTSICIYALAMEDGKIDLGDITSLPKAGSVLSELIEVGKEYKEMLAELKDLDKEEFKELLDAAFDG